MKINLILLSGIMMLGIVVGSSANAGKGGGSRDLQQSVSLTVSNPVVVGKLNREIIVRYVKKKLSDIKYCYFKALSSNPTLSNGLSVSIKWVIDGSGRVTVVADGDHVGNAAVANCIENVVATIVFPAPESGGAVKVSQSFMFK